jgi:hypothetical protein
MRYGKLFQHASLLSWGLELLHQWRTAGLPWMHAMDPTSHRRGLPTVCTENLKLFIHLTFFDSLLMLT